jgi:ABC-type Fe3+/spermidine/putrescine transport system ATPase subunit
VTKLELSHLGCRFDDFVAVNDVNFDVAEGELICLLGPSGCGKTTTLRLIAGFLTPTTGFIRSEGVDLSSASEVVPPEHRNMSMIFQSYAIWPNMNVAQNVAFGLKVRGLDKREISQRVGEMLDVVQLGKLAERYPAELSGGQQQRVALARAMIIQPKILLMDEPLSNLDARLRNEMRLEIRRLHDRFKVTTVYVTHDQDEAMAIADRIVVMNNGRVEQIASPWDIYNRPTTKFVAEFIGRTNFLEGHGSGGHLRFPGFSVPVQIDRPSQPSVFSVRPEKISLGSAVTGERSGKISSRSYLGDHWDYNMQVDGGGELLVKAPSDKIFQVGDQVGFTIDESSFVRIETAS